MAKIVAWILSLTKIGKIVEPVQNFISGYKSYIAGAGLAIPALLSIIQNFADKGTPYLLGVAGTPEWAVLLNGLAIMGLRAAISKASPDTAQ